MADTEKGMASVSVLHGHVRVETDFNPRPMSARPLHLLSNYRRVSSIEFSNLVPYACRGMRPQRHNCLWCHLSVFYALGMSHYALYEDHS